jgi:hypothetical protein
MCSTRKLMLHFLYSALAPVHPRYAILYTPCSLSLHVAAIHAMLPNNVQYQNAKPNAFITLQHSYRHLMVVFVVGPAPLSSAAAIVQVKMAWEVAGSL